MTEIHSDLIKKYNVPGPRYTSYPTVPYWEANPTEKDWMASVQAAFVESKQRGEGAAIYIHIPFCESLCTYCGCNTRITRNHAVESPYVETVLKEWKLYQDHLKAVGRLPIREIHLGGGTPTFLAPAQLQRLITGILEATDVLPHHEFSLEADPRVTTREHLETLAHLGFKRLSLGIQDFDPKVQEIVHRTQSEEQVRGIVEIARELGYTSINFDLIYGLPLQTQQSIEQTVQAVCRLRPDRIAFYAYAHVPWIKASQRRFTEADLPSGTQKRELYELGRSLLEAAGYREIGMDHFALETDSLWTASRDHKLHRNFMGYTSQWVSPLIGLGVSAIGDSWTCFAQNEKHLESYQRLVEKGEIPIHRGHLLTAEDQTVRRHILNLMTRFETDFTSEALDQNLKQAVLDRLAEPLSDGLVRLEENRLLLQEIGKPFIRNICMAFDRRLAEKSPQSQLFSKTI